MAERDVSRVSGINCFIASLTSILFGKLFVFQLSEVSYRDRHMYISQECTKQIQIHAKSIVNNTDGIGLNSFAATKRIDVFIVHVLLFALNANFAILQSIVECFFYELFDESYARNC